MKRFLLAALLMSAPIAAPAQAVISWPLSAPTHVDLNSTPIVSLGTNTIDFTPYLGQQFIGFQFQTLIQSNTVIYGFAMRARDGLASFTGHFPASIDPSFPNLDPPFTVGSTDLFLFDVKTFIGQPVSFDMTDLNGVPHTANFQAGPSATVPEPSTWMMMLTGFIVVGVTARKRSRLSHGVRA